MEVSTRHILFARSFTFAMFWIYWRVMHRFITFSRILLWHRIRLGIHVSEALNTGWRVGNATRKRKVFAHPESFGSGIPLKCLGSLRTVWKVFGQSRFSGQCESPWTAWKVFGQPGIFLEFVLQIRNCLDYKESFQSTLRLFHHSSMPRSTWK